MRINEKGQVTLGLVGLVAVILYVLMMNLQSQAQIVQRKIIEAKSTLEAENAINDFALQLYTAYASGSLVPESLNGDLRKPKSSIGPLDSPTYNGFDFYIKNGQLCSSRSRNGRDANNICIHLPADFVTLLLKSDIYNFELISKPTFFVRVIQSLFKISTAEAQRVQTQSSAPSPIAAPPNLPPLINVNRSLSPPPSMEEIDFTNQYENYHCDTPTTRIACVKIRICLKTSGCTHDSEWIKQTYVFLRLPNTQLRD